MRCQGNSPLLVITTRVRLQNQVHVVVRFFSGRNGNHIAACLRSYLVIAVSDMNKIPPLMNISAKRPYFYNSTIISISRRVVVVYLGVSVIVSVLNKMKPLHRFFNSNDPPPNQCGTWIRNLYLYCSGFQCANPAHSINSSFIGSGIVRICHTV